MRAVHRLGTSRPSLLLRRPHLRRRLHGGENGEVTAGPVAGPSKSPTLMEARGYHVCEGNGSGANGNDGYDPFSRELGSSFIWIAGTRGVSAQRRRFCTTARRDQGRDDTRQPEERSSSATADGSSIDADELAASPPARSLGQQFRDVFRRRLDRDSIAVSPHSSAYPGFLPSADYLPSPQQRLLSEVADLLSSVDVRAHAFKLGGYEAPSEALWAHVQELHAHGLSAHLHPDSFHKLLRVCAKHSWASPAALPDEPDSLESYVDMTRAERAFKSREKGMEGMPSNHRPTRTRSPTPNLPRRITSSPSSSSNDQASSKEPWRNPRYFDFSALPKRVAPAEQAHTRILFLLDRIIERTVMNSSSEASTPLTTAQLAKCRHAALEHYADWGFFAGAEVVWDVFNRERVPTDKRAYALVLVCAAREVQSRMWLQGPDIKGNLFRVNRWKRSVTAEVKRIIRRSESLLGESGQAGQLSQLAVRSLAQSYAAVSSEAKLQRLLKTAWGFDLQSLDSGGRLTDPAVVNAVLRMRRGKGELGRMMAFLETIAHPLPRPSPDESVGFFDGGYADAEGRKKGFSGTPEKGAWQDVPVTTRSYREVIGAARDLGDVRLGIHYVQEAQRAYKAYVRHLHGLFDPRSSPSQPSPNPPDVPFASLRLLPNVWDELEPWLLKDRYWLPKLVSAVQDVQNHHREELAWWIAYAQCRSDPKWAHVVEIGAQLGLDGEKRKRTSVPRSLMTKTARELLAPHDAYLHACERVEFLVYDAIPWNDSWLKRSQYDVGVLFARHRLRHAERWLRRSQQSPIRGKPVQKEEEPDKESLGEGKRVLEKRLRKRVKDLMRARLSRQMFLHATSEDGRGGTRRRRMYRSMAKEEFEKAKGLRARWVAMRVGEHRHPGTSTEGKGRQTPEDDEGSRRAFEAFEEMVEQKRFGNASEAGNWDQVDDAKGKRRAALMEGKQAPSEARP